MNLPNYFLADLPPQAQLSPQIISEACQTLRRNRAHYLAEWPLEQLIQEIAEVAGHWLDPANPFRQRALELGPAATGFSKETLAHGLDAFFGTITEAGLRALVTQDLGHPQRLERFCATDTERETRRAAFACGPEVVAHLTGGVLPTPAITSMVVGLLTRSAQFLKCATGTSLVPRLFAHSLHEFEPKLGACLEIAEWKGGTAALESALFAEVDCVTAMGHDHTLATLRQHLPPSVRFVGYGHRVSFAYVTQEMLQGSNPLKTIQQAAEDVAAWDQLGCLSPHVLYVEESDAASPERFAELLAAQLAAYELRQPRGALSPQDAAAIATRRSFYEVRAAHSPDTRLWCSPNSTAWTVVYEHEPRFQTSCLNRFIYVKPALHLTHVLENADAVRGQVSTVGLAAPEPRAVRMVAELARWGVSRVCPLGRMQRPPLTWRHDGRPSLADWVRWTDWEQ